MSSTDYNHSDSDAHLHVFPNPIQRLCPDILAEIFTFCLPDVPKNFRYISSWNVPLLLCSVCSSWRSLAISTPRLWQTFYFRMVDKTLTIDTESITSGIHTWLDRSGALPLSIRVIFWIRDPESDRATQRRLILEVLSQEASRWERFEIYDEEICLTPPHFGILPMLHTLTLGSSIDGIPFTAAPCLKRLCLFSLPNPTSLSAIPWDRLVELTIIQKAQTISMVAEVIQCCPRLESLSLPVRRGDKDGSLTFKSIIQHDTLRRLHLDTRRPYADAVIDHLTFPALTDLSMSAYHCDFGAEAESFCSRLVHFFTRSNCGLQEFELYCPGFGPGELLECLRHRSCQTLTQLVIQGDKGFIPMVDSDLIIRLTYPDDDGDATLCPQLRHLTLNYCYCSDFPGVLGRMIRSRCMGHAQDAQLRSLQFKNTYSLSKEDDELLQFARSNYGLEFSYYYGDDDYRQFVINNPTWFNVF